MDACKVITSDGLLQQELLAAFAKGGVAVSMRKSGERGQTASACHKFGQSGSSGVECRCSCMELEHENSPQGELRHKRREARSCAQNCCVRACACTARCLCSAGRDRMPADGCEQGWNSNRLPNLTVVWLRMLRLIHSIQRGKMPARTS